MKNPQLICFGEPLYELNQPRDNEPYIPGIGGDTLNCGVAAARQGASVACIGALGNDRFGRDIRKLWDKEAISHDLVKDDPDAPTGLYIIYHSSDGHEFSYYRSASAATRYSPEDIPEEAIAAADILHLSGITHAISETSADAAFAAMEIARANGTRVSYDTNLRLALWPLERAQEVINQAASLSDILLPGLDDARQLTGLSGPDEIVDFYLASGAGLVALTMGHDGTLVANGDKRERLAALPVDAVDATAAGDTFDGAFLAEMLVHGDPFRAARYANAAAALSTLGYGATAPMPHRNEVESFLTERGVQI